MASRECFLSGGLIEERINLRIPQNMLVTPCFLVMLAIDDEDRLCPSSGEMINSVLGSPPTCLYLISSYTCLDWDCGTRQSSSKTSNKVNLVI